MALTLSEEKSGTAGGGILVTVHMQLSRQDGGAAEELCGRGSKS